MQEYRTPDEAPTRVFSEEEQAAIIARAAALQREHGQMSSLSELERAAVEAGIELRFVREAVRLQPSPAATAVEVRSPSSDHIWRAVLASAVFVPAEVAAISWSHNLRPSVWGALVVAVLFGLALPRRAYARWVAVAWTLFVAMSILTFDPFTKVMGVLLLTAIQAAVSLGVNVATSHRGGHSFGARGVGTEPTR